MSTDVDLRGEVTSSFGVQLMAFLTGRWIGFRRFSPSLKSPSHTASGWNASPYRILLTVAVENTAFSCSYLDCQALTRRLGVIRWSFEEAPERFAGEA